MREPNGTELLLQLIVPNLDYMIRVRAGRLPARFLSSGSSAQLF